MKLLPLEFISGDGGFSTCPHHFKQVKRNCKAAIYERQSPNSNTKFWEVFKIHVLPKNTRIFQKILDDDEEQYPSNGKFGISSWCVTTLERANQRFEEISN